MKKSVAPRSLRDEKRMSLVSSVYGTISCGTVLPSVLRTRIQNGRSSP